MSTANKTLPDRLRSYKYKMRSRYFLDLICQYSVRIKAIQVFIQTGEVLDLNYLEIIQQKQKLPIKTFIK